MKKYNKLIYTFFFVFLSTFLGVQEFSSTTFADDDRYEDEERPWKDSSSKKSSQGDDEWTQAIQAILDSQTQSKITSTQDTTIETSIEPTPVLPVITPTKNYPKPSTKTVSSQQTPPTVSTHTVSSTKVLSNGVPVKPVSSFISSNGKVFPIAYNENKGEFIYIDGGSSGMHSFSKAEIIAYLNAENPFDPTIQRNFQQVIPPSNSIEYTKAVALAEAQIEEIFTKNPGKAFAFERPSLPTRFSQEQTLAIKKNTSSTPKTPTIPPVKEVALPKRTSSTSVKKPTKVSTTPPSKPVTQISPPTVVTQTPVPPKVTPKPTPPKVVTPKPVPLPPPDTTTRAS